MAYVNILTATNHVFVKSAVLYRYSWNTVHSLSDISQCKTDT